MSSPDELFRQALTSLQMRNPVGAERLFKQALRAAPGHIPALNLLAITLMQLGRLDEAEDYMKRAAQADPRSDQTLSNYGLLLQALKRPAEAYDRFSEALAINPSVAETWHNRGAVLKDLNRQEEAVTDFDRAIALKPALAESWLGRGNVLADLGRDPDALAAYDRALALRPDLAEAWLGRGNLLTRRHDFVGALAAYDRALALQSNLAETWLGRGNALTHLGRYGEALAAYDKALAIQPHLPYALGQRLYVKSYLCDWSDQATDVAELLAALRADRPASLPFPLLTLSSTAADQLRGAKNYMALQTSHRASSAPAPQTKEHLHGRLRIAYLSADFGEHPVTYAMVGVLGAHDRTKFEITAVSLAKHRESAIRTRLEQTAERFVDAAMHDDDAIAGTLRNLDIQIAIDLNGLTDGARPGVFLRRPAPIQVNYLGYPSTIGSTCFDYILADRCTIAEDEQTHFVECVGYLPDTYFPFDRQRAISDRSLTRREVGLPETGFVFCCFNNSYKINPPVFDIWMRLLHDIEGSVLWLSAVNETAKDNLRREAQARGVTPDRLIFAPRLENNADHLARLRLADLFLDTLPYNAHATASDALWAGLPVLTRIGDTFAGRVAASLLHAAGLPELIVHSAEDYENAARGLAQTPDRLAALKSKLAHNHGIAPLFDTARFTRHLEAAYTIMWETHCRDEQPRSFAVAPA